MHLMRRMAFKREGIYFPEKQSGFSVDERFLFPKDRLVKHNKLRAVSECESKQPR